MGQQQLLLVILVTIIVGIATVVAINIFGSAADQANRDAVRQDLMAAAVQAQGVWSRPAMMNGANRSFSDYVNDNSIGELMERLNIPSNTFDGSSGVLNNENGEYTLTVQGDEELTISADPSSGGEPIEMSLSRDEDTGRWVVEIEGTSTDDEN